jgi:hypothetical protein
MAVSYAQFIIEFPEFGDSSITAMVTGELAFFDSVLEGFANYHDGAVYRRTAVSINRKMGGQNMVQIPTNGELTTYEKEWGEYKLNCYRRATISGGGAG